MFQYVTCSNSLLSMAESPDLRCRPILTLPKSHLPLTCGAPGSHLIETTSLVNHLSPSASLCAAMPPDALESYLEASSSNTLSSATITSFILLISSAQDVLQIERRPRKPCLEPECIHASILAPLLIAIKLQPEPEWANIPHAPLSVASRSCGNEESRCKRARWNADDLSPRASYIMIALPRVSLERNRP